MNINLQKRMDTVASEQDHLTRELVQVKMERDVDVEDNVTQEVSTECKDEYINDFAFLLGPHLEAVPADVATETHSKPSDIRVVVEPADQYAPKLTPVVEFFLVVDHADDLVETITAL